MKKINAQLMRAIYHPNSDRMIEELLDSGADPDITDSNGSTALMLAANLGMQVAVKKLLSKTTNINTINKDNSSVLMDVTMNNDDVILSLLIKRGANLNIRHYNGETALMAAAFMGYGKIVELLINNGADLNIKNDAGESAIFSAVNNREQDIVNILLKAGADIDITNYAKRTVLDVALQNDDFISIVMLDKNSLNKQDKKGNSLLMRACQLKEEKSVMFLFNSGADYNLKNNDGYSALDILEKHWNLPDVLQSLKEKLILDQLLEDEPSL